MVIGDCNGQQVPTTLDTDPAGLLWIDSTILIPVLVSPPSMELWSRQHS